MDMAVIIVCVVLGTLGSLSAILAFAAERTKLTPSEILVDSDVCIYPPSPALALGVSASIFLLVTQIIASAVSGCFGCCRSRAIPSETKRIVGVLCAVISWIAAVIAWVLLVQGASLNGNVTLQDGAGCIVLKNGVFAGAGVLTLVVTALGIASYIVLRGQPPAGATKPGGHPLPNEIAIGQPQFLPPQAGYAQPQQPYYPQYPPQPQAYGQAAQLAPSAPSQGYGQAPNPLYPPAPAPGYWANATNQEFPPKGHEQV